MFSLLWTLIVGLVVGAIAKLLIPGRDPGGILITMGLGVVGSFIGTYAGRFLGYGETYQAGFLMSILGAVIVLGIYRLIVGRRTAT
jgi:uncharacterized membrane protein YeaQ/YmgE (transglycosylase-associated protein family)